jgi:putative transposase
VIQELLGYSVLRMTRRAYAHLLNATVAKTVEKRLPSFGLERSNVRKLLPTPSAVNRSWSMDFVSDGLCDGRRLRVLAIVDDFSRECLVLEVDTSITGRRVVAVLERLADLRGLPLSITAEHGPEFEGQVLLDTWAYHRGVRLSFIRPGEPVENAYVESFNGRFRDECLNEHWFLTMAHARRVCEEWFGEDERGRI